MTKIIERLKTEIHLESAAISPRTSGLIEAARAAQDEIKRLLAIEGAAQAVLHDMEVGNWSQYKQDALAEALGKRGDRS